METKEIITSNSQKYIFVISILNIIGGVFYLIIGVLGFMGKSIAGNEALIQQAGEESAPALVTAFIIMIILSGAFSLLLGFLGIRAAKDASKIGPVYILAMLSLIISVVNLFVGIFGGNFLIQSLIEIVPPALMFWCAGNVKKQA